MKRLLQSAILLLIFLFAGCKNRDELDIMDNEGLALYWHHAANAEKGRQLFLSFGNSKPSTEKADYKFEYKILGRVIEVQLVEKVSRGKCQVFPGPDGDKCSSWGNIYIPENELSEGAYKLRLQTGKSVVASDLIVGHNQYELNVPANPYLANYIPFVYAIPKNIIFGSVWYDNAANERYAKAFIDDLTRAGLKPTTVPAHQYQFLSEDRQTHLAKSFWEPDNHTVNLLLSWKGDFKKVVEICKKHFELSEKKIGIGLWNSDYMEQIIAEPHGKINAFTR